RNDCGDERLADDEPWVAPVVEERDLGTVLGEERCQRATGNATADDCDAGRATAHRTYVAQEPSERQGGQRCRGRDTQGVGADSRERMADQPDSPGMRGDRLR